MALEYVLNKEFRLKVINLLKGYGYYKGVLVDNDIQKKYIDGELKLSEIIKSKSQFKELKASVNVVLDYCYQNSFNELEHVMNYFYRKECFEVRKLYGGIFDKF